MSGGPLLRNFDGKRGDAIGVIGGWKTGGTIDDESYSSQFDADIIRVYNQAVNDYAPDSRSRLRGRGKRRCPSGRPLCQRVWTRAVPT
ncbi:hypothetical protein [Streptomyces sp. CB00455]|uniref:hypothetical protein n=1 Tax=Streptomyces sp. CB00455 TaxID=1703927 RepID=UPI000A44B4C8|nr:hypothetical protein [Streptomyces sp. CB00455]